LAYNDPARVGDVLDGRRGERYLHNRQGNGV